MSVRAVLRLLAFALAAQGIQAQIRLHPGVSVGAALTDPYTSQLYSSYDGSSTSTSGVNPHKKPLLLGLSLRAEFNPHWSVEFDASHRRLDADSYDLYKGAGGAFSSTNIRSWTDQWEFPFLIQYSRALPRTRASWFIAGGPSIRRIVNSGGLTSSFSNLAAGPPVSSSDQYSYVGETSPGFTFGAGRDRQFGRIHLRPAFRFSHWFGTAASPSSVILDPIGAPSGATAVLASISSYNVWLAPQSVPLSNEASVLLGLSF